MDRSPGFGSTSYNFFALFRLDFSSAPCLQHLTSLHNVTRWTVLQKVRYRTYTVLYLLVNIGFQVLFTPLPGFFSPFPHGTSPLSVTEEYLALEGGPSDFQPGSSCLVVLWILPCQLAFRLLDFHYLWSSFPECSAILVESIM